MDLSSTIKKNQDVVKNVQLKANEPKKPHQLKQDDLLAKKDQSVVPMSVATVPEKPQYQKRLYANGGDPGLSIVGQQTHRVTTKQFRDHVKATEELYQSLASQYQMQQALQQQTGPIVVENHLHDPASAANLLVE